MKSFAAAILMLGLGLSPAAACGWKNERCCSTKKGGEACKVDGLICISGRCREEPQCGGNGEACCGGDDGTCDAHSLVCLSGSCTPCGKEGEPVCNEDGVSPCNEGLEPSGGICAVICGDAGWPCCENDTCKVDGLTCISGTCSDCGSEGEPVCSEAPICEGDLIDVGGICTSPPPCGGAGEACCPPDDGCDLHSLACVSGTCTPCGKEGEPVCTEDGVSPCNTGLEDSEGICVVPPPPCGKEGEPICPEEPICEGDLVDVGGVCTVPPPPPPCGGNGEIVCPGDSPCADDLVAIGGFCQGAPDDCGGLNEACCPGDACDSDDTICRNGFCAACGTNAKPACAGDDPCADGLEVSGAGFCIPTKKSSFPKFKFF